MPRRRSEAVEDASEQPRNPGAFMTDGSWNQDATLAMRGDTHRIVAALARRRRFDRLTPAMAASAIEAGAFTNAFPWWHQWATCLSWSEVWTATAAEEAVKREGRGVDGHWCGDRWAKGSEKDCHDSRHRDRPSRDETERHVAAILANVAVPRHQPDAPSKHLAPNPPPPRAPDEHWPGWRSAGYNPDGGAA